MKEHVEIRAIKPSASPKPPTEKSRNPLRRLYDWVLSWANHPAGAVVLFLVAALDSCILLMPPYPLLIALCLGRPKRSLLFATLCSLGSILGAVGGYFIGLELGNLVRDFCCNHLGWIGFTQGGFDDAKMLYQKNVYFTIIIAGALMPFPFKVFTIGAGILHVSFGDFLLATTIARTVRFFALSVVLYFWGEKAQKFIDRYFMWVALGFIALVGVGIWLIPKILHLLRPLVMQ